MRQYFHRWFFDFCLASAFALIAFVIRQKGYPICPSDELSWHKITQILQKGKTWPVSGPGYVLGLESLSAITGKPLSQSIPEWGIFSVWAIVLLLLRLYRIMLSSYSWIAIVALALSSYFWAPLLESRPQQWGQLLVFMGSFLCWRWLQQAPQSSKTAPFDAPTRNNWLSGLGLLLVLPLTAYVHILSHAVLLWMCMLLLLGQRIAWPQQVRWFAHACLGVVVLLSAGVYLLPNGPYALMLHDIQQNHLARVNGLIMGGVFLLGTLIVVTIYGRRTWPGWNLVTHVLSFTAQHARLCQGILFGMLTMALASQAVLLPPEAWHPYGGSVSRFMVFQLGNVALAVCLISGSMACLRNANPPWPAIWTPFLLISLFAITSLACLSIFASIWLLHTNWMLRLINYGLLFAAPIAAAGLLHLSYTWPRWISMPVFGVCSALSLLSVFRHPAFLQC